MIHATTMIRPILLLAVALLATGSEGAAQTGGALSVGERVRAELRPPLHDDALVHGRVAGLRGDTVVLRLNDGGATATLPAVSIERLHVSRGTESRTRSTLRGVIRGLLTAAAVLPIVEVTNGDDRAGTGDVALLFGSGTLLGAVRGYRHPRERWTEVPVGALP